MTTMFDALHTRIDATGARLTETAQTASSEAVEQFSRATSGIQAAFDQMRGEIADIGGRLTAGADAAATRNAECSDAPPMRSRPRPGVPRPA
jgi:hypothetical protein